ncbi:unnamed protein product [Cuscuta campestris]|uniref:DUF8039 domain-containing protein n=1 Tax=Cuscuta campestris TaxID=132261 RepID=A0A484KVG1_9ASTE|nr:unnamed protein product [Cuscuta campestris]
MASTQQHSQAGREIHKPILRSSLRHEKPEALSDRNELQCHSSPKPKLRKSPRLKRKDRPSTLTVVQALSGSRSKNVQSHSTPLPVTPKPKPISDNVQKQIKQKRKREEVESESVAKPSRGGLKLRKRGCVSMHRVVKQMQSYIGVLARTKAPIWFDTWRQVPVTIKNKIWKSVTLGFDLPPSARKLVLQSVNPKWKQFKSTLTCRYILPFRDEPKKLRTPPEDFSFLEKNHLDIFVADRLSPEFLKVHDEHVKRVKENKYPHRLSRKGYANLEQEWAKTHSGDELVIDRSVTWVLARKDKEGNFKCDSTKQKAEELNSGSFSRVLKGTSMLCQMAQLAVGSVDNIVAHAKVYGFSRMDDLTLHGEKLGEEYAKVSITKEIQDVDIPVPIPGEVLTVEQSKGTFVAWPKELIVLDVLPKGKSNLKTVKKKKAPKRLKKAHVLDDEECGQEFQVELGPEYPLQLKRLCCLYELVKKNKMLQMISFVDPGMVRTLACGNIGQRSRKLADCFKGACDGQHFLISFNDVNHWALTVVKPNEEVVYYMDPLKRRIDSQ